MREEGGEQTNCCKRFSVFRIWFSRAACCWGKNLETTWGMAGACTRENPWSSKERHTFQPPCIMPPMVLTRCIMMLMAPLFNKWGGMIEAQIGKGGGWLGGLRRGLVAEHFEQNSILHAGQLMHRYENQEQTRRTEQTKTRGS